MSEDSRKKNIDDPEKLDIDSFLERSDISLKLQRNLQLSRRHVILLDTKLELDIPDIIFILTVSDAHILSRSPVFFNHLFDIFSALYSV